MKLIENIIIIGLLLLLGLGIYFSHKHFIETIEEKPEPEVEETLGSAVEQEQEFPPEEQPIEEHHEEENHSHTISLGVYKITAYCGCVKCCGKTDGITASGAKVKAKHTIAAPLEIPFGTQLVINGHTYTVEDRGGAIKGKRIDIYFDTHEEALAFGVQYVEVFQVVNE